MRTILLSETFKTTWGEKVKRPFEFVMSGLRAVADELILPLNSDSDNLINNYKYMGQRLLYWKAPNGYPDFQEDWTGSSSLLQRWRTANWLIDWKIDDVYVLDVLGQTPDDVRSANQLTDYWSDRLLGRALPEPERTYIVEFMAQWRDPDGHLPVGIDPDVQERLRSMVGLLMQTPSFQWR